MATRQIPLQPLLPFLSPPATPGSSVLVSGRVYRVVLARHRRARRYVLRLNDDETLRLTVPRGASIEGGLTFVSRQGAWIERQRARQRARLEPWRDGTTFWYRGARERVAVGAAGAITWAGERVLAAGMDIRTAIEAHIAAQAADELPRRCLELAARHRLSVLRVSVRNQRSRWGACSSRGVITLNWRLLQMPPSVSDYVIFHELMHLRHQNHSVRFWRAVAGVCEWWRDAERWLRRHGREVL